MSSKSTSISILGTGCTTSTGNSVREFMLALETGADSLVPVETSNWKIPPKPGFEPRAFRWRDRSDETARELLTRKLKTAFEEAAIALPVFTKSAANDSARIGVILASTKGFTEDFVWENETKHFTQDPLTPLLNDAILACHLKPSMKICVSNACASSLAALAVAKTWLAANRVDHVVVFACDAVDSFVLHGFHHLRVLSPDRTRPFSESRSGFHLGDAAACVILSSKIESEFKLKDAKIDSEGHAATRPSDQGESLLRACRNLDTFAESEPELVIAHGTSTKANDVTEDRVFTALFNSTSSTASLENSPAVTGTKWSVGHTLGAAGLLDVIAAVEVLKSQKVFAIATSSEVDKAFKSNYVFAGSKQVPTFIKRVLVTSLGFGGVHAAALVELEEKTSKDLK